MAERTEPERPIQRLTKEPPTSITKPYTLQDNYGLFITFQTAQEAFNWIAIHTPAAVTNVKIP